jgi:cathepsin D
MMDTGKSSPTPSVLGDKLFSMESLALLTLHVAINSFSHFSTDISLQGAALISGHPEVVDHLYSRIPGAQPVNHGYYTFPCDTVLPDIVFEFDGFPVSITYNFNLGSWQMGSPYCLGSIMAVETDNVWTMGTIFMTNYYAVFEVVNRRVGFANLA